MDLEIEIINALKSANKITISNMDKTLTFEMESKKFKNIIDTIKNDTFFEAYSMPALSVTANSFVEELKKQGMFLEIEFDREFDFDGFNFDKLGFLVNEDYTGVDINRSVLGKYFGRNFYLNLKGNMASLKKYLISLF